MATTTLDIFRYQPDASDEAYRQSSTLEHEGDITLLDAILRLQDEQDGTLAIRYSCRSAICGSCACRANGKTVLACMSQVEDVKEEFGTDTIQVDPIGNFAPLKDLIVDLDPFWDKFKSVKPYLIPDGPAPERERLVSKEDMQKLFRRAPASSARPATRECNSLAADPEFVGPAAFAWGYRFAGDVRDGQRKERAKLYTGDHGVWDCTRCMYCNERCPKGVNPRDAIEKLGGIAFQEGARCGQRRPPRQGLPRLDAHRRQAQRDPAGPAHRPDQGAVRPAVRAPDGPPRQGAVADPPQIKKLDEVKALMKNVKETI